MIEAAQVTLSFGSRTLFENVSAKFTPGNCFGLIGANGAGKSTFLKILAGEIEPTAGNVNVSTGERISVLRQDHFAYDEETVVDTVLMGQKELFDIMREKDAIYSSGNFSDADGLRVADLEADFAAMNGWNAESDAGVMLSGLGIDKDLHSRAMKTLSDNEKLRVLLAQALFGEPDILLLDEPTNHLDVRSILWLEEFLANFKQTVIVVSHDRHFLNNVCTHIADIDFNTIRLYTGNYEYWYEASQLALQQKQDRNKKAEDKAKELKAFIARFSANASKSRQATSRKKLLSRLGGEEILPSTRRYPHIVFKPLKAAGKDMLHCEEVSYDGGEGRTVHKLNLTINRGERVVLVGNELAPISTILGLLGGVLQPQQGTVRWGGSTVRGYFPKDHEEYFDQDINLLEWLRQYSENKEENFVRSFLGKMLFTRDESLKSAKVLSGGEKVRCMLAKLMMEAPNVLILDGPTNHLDLESITALNNSLLAFDGTLVLNSQDVQFVESLATRVLVLGETSIIGDYADYGDYAANHLRMQQAKSA
jgi:ATPase subunit of ABC transporter with duplicated ATPase domains